MFEAHTAYHFRHFRYVGYIHGTVERDIQLLHHLLFILVGEEVHPVVEVFGAGRIVILRRIGTEYDERMSACADILAIYPEMCGGLYYEHEPAFCAVWSVYAETSAVSVIVAYFDHFHELSLL